MTVEKATTIANKIMIAVQSAKYRTVFYNPSRYDYNHSHLVDAVIRGAKTERETLLETMDKWLSEHGMSCEMISELKNYLEDISYQ